MTREDKELLLKDLCARLPYKVIVEFVSYECEEKPWFGELSCKSLDYFIHDVGIIEIKPYLRPMSSMTDEEKFAYRKTQWVYQADYCAPEYFDGLESYDWLNKNHFDYRGLIEKGLAIEAPEGMMQWKRKTPSVAQSANCQIDIADAMLRLIRIKCSRNPTKALRYERQ